MTAGAEVHIAGVLVHARPEYLPAVLDAIGALPKAEVTQHAEDGRVVAVLEGDSDDAVAQQIDAIRAVRGVLNAALVYQHAEAEQELGKEIQG